MSPEAYLRAFFEAIPDYKACVLDTGGLGLCAEMTQDLVDLFPVELKRVRGHIRMLVVAPDERDLWPHWWCLTDAGEIVDPTRAQFGPGAIVYEQADENNLPTGKCPNCGELCYEHSYFCTDACGTAYVAYCNGTAHV